MKSVDDLGCLARLPLCGAWTPFAIETEEDVRWNTWTRVHNVHVEGEPKSIPRPLRLCCPAVSPGDPVQVIEGRRVTEGVIVEIHNATIIVSTSRQ